jgi:hypothetical protein
MGRRRTGRVTGACTAEAVSNFRDVKSMFRFREYVQSHMHRQDPKIRPTYAAPESLGAEPDVLQGRHRQKNFDRWPCLDPSAGRRRRLFCRGSPPIGGLRAHSAPEPTCWSASY